MGCCAFLFYFKGTPSWILPKAFCRQLSPKCYNFMQKLEGAANHMQHLSICFFITSAPI
jgi:trehalose-6-phosphatase